MFSALRTKLKGWRTVIFHAAYGIPSVILLFSDQIKSAGIDVTPILKRWLTPDGILFATTMMAIIGVFLRVITTTPIGKSEPESQ
jgi:hypothetical protein